MEIRLNLLPIEKKQEIQKKSRFRLVVWQGLTFIVLILFYLGVLSGIYFTLNVQVEGERKTSAIESESKNLQEVITAERVFQDTNAKIESIERFQREHITWSRALLDMDQLVPEGIAIESLHTNERKVSLSGRADDRDTLLKFQEIMNASGCFHDAKLPLSDLFSQKNIDFQMDTEIDIACLKPKNL